MMLINVSVKRMNVDMQLQSWIERRMQFALGRFVSRVRRVSVILTDINGTRGGPDKHCRLLIDLNSGSEVCMEDVDVSVEAVVATVAERASRTVARALERMRDSRNPRSGTSKGGRITIR